jgi:hypothetical protein
MPVLEQAYDRTMNLTLAIAIVVSVIWTARSLRFSDFAYQRSWSPLATLFAYLVFLGIGAAAGWGGWRAATAIGWRPTSSHFLLGVIYGTFGNAIVRVHLKKIPDGNVEEAFTILTVLSDIVAGILDVKILDAVSRGLERMQPEVLAQYVSYLFYRSVANDERYDQKARKMFEATIAANVDDIVGGTSAKRVQAQSSLRALGEDWAARYRVRRPEPL